MKKRFVLATQSTTIEENQAFKDRINAEFPGVGWWHRLDELWLLSDSKGRLDPQKLRDIAGECFAGKRLLVLQLDDDGDTWAGRSPREAAKIFAWLHTYWKDD